MASFASSRSVIREKACLNRDCQNDAPKRCSKCKAVRFCGPDCQMLLWDSHKALCKSIAKEPEATVLLLDGMGSLGPDMFYTKAVQAALARAGTKVATVDVTKKPGLIDQVGSVLSEARRFTSCIALGVGDGEVEAERDFCESMYFRRKLLAWVQMGGRLVIQGSRTDGCWIKGALTDVNWPEWFDKTWRCSDYRRTTHECRAKSRDDVHWCKWYPEINGSITTTINVKAVLMKCVASEDILFGTTSASVSHSLVPFMAGLSIEEGLAAVAFGRFGEGSVSFFGDVNAEDSTCAIMAVIARGP